MRSLALVTLLALTLAACGGGSGGGLPATGTLKLMVTDGPFEWDLVESATVCIVRVEARNADLEGWQVLYDGEAVPEPDPDALPDAPPPEAPGCAEVDLMPLSGGITALITEIEVPVGTYNEVRLIVDAGQVVLSGLAEVAGDPADPDSHTFNTENGKLRFPSGAQTGIKVKIENDIVVSSQLSADLVLEFDLARNFVFNGQPDAAPGVKRINFTPVVRATNATTNGTIALEVWSDAGTEDTADDAALPYPTVDVYAVTIDEATSAEVATYATTATGSETGTLLISLAPGTYRLDVMAMGHDTTSVGLTTVVVGNVTDAGTVTLAMSQFWLGGHVLSDQGTPVGDPPAGTETDDDLPIAGATVSVWDAAQDPDVDAALATATTDTGGGWTVTGLTAGTYTVRITADGHADAEVTDVVVNDWVPTTVDTTLVQDVP